MAASGQASAQAFERRFSGQDSQIQISRGLWSRYLRGEVIPKDGLERAKDSLVSQLNKEFPGTEAIFHHPIWLLIDCDAPYSPNLLWFLFVQLDESVWRHFVATVPVAKNKLKPLNIPFWKVHRGEYERIKLLRELDGLDGLAACLIEARMGYFTQSFDLYANSMAAARDLFPKLRKNKLFTPVKVQLALLIMEGFCLLHLTLTLRALAITDMRLDSRNEKASAWRQDWSTRCKVQGGKLKGKARASFNEWLKLAGLVR